MDVRIDPLPMQRRALFDLDIRNLRARHEYQARIFLFIREKWNGNSSDSFEGFWEK